MGGVDGVDFNNYEAGIGTSADEMIWIAQQLIDAYGPNFIITTPPQPNASADLSLCKAMADAGVLTYAAPQFYDWAGFNDARLHQRPHRDLGQHPRCVQGDDRPVGQLLQRAGAERLHPRVDGGRESEPRRCEACFCWSACRVRVSWLSRKR